MPLSVQAHGNRDSDAYLIESVISVHDCGKWVADISVLQMFDGVDFRACQACGNHPAVSPPLNLIAVGNWDELLETPESDFIVRANGNWLARLALAAVCHGLGLFVLALPSPVCWHCCNEITEEHEVPEVRLNQLLALIY